MRGCPCFYTTPCHPDCTCVQPASSRGCLRCCSYGSPEQQRAMAELLASKIATLAAVMDVYAEGVAVGMVAVGREAVRTESSQLEHLASAMKKVLPPELLTELLDHLDPLPRFLAALREEP